MEVGVGESGMDMKDEPCKLDRDKAAKQQILVKLREINGTEKVEEGVSIDQMGKGVNAMQQLKGILEEGVGMVKQGYTPDDSHEELPKAPPGGSGEMPEQKLLKCGVMLTESVRPKAETCARCSYSYECVGRISGGASVAAIGVGLAAAVEANYEAGPVNATPHEFKGRQDQGCEICGKPDRHWIHVRASVEMVNQIRVEGEYENDDEVREMTRKLLEGIEFESMAGPDGVFRDKHGNAVTPLPDDEVELELKFPDGKKKFLRGKKKDFWYLTGGLKKGTSHLNPHTDIGEAFDACDGSGKTVFVMAKCERCLLGYDDFGYDGICFRYEGDKFVSEREEGHRHLIPDEEVKFNFCPTCTRPVNQ